MSRLKTPAWRVGSLVVMVFVTLGAVLDVSRSGRTDQGGTDSPGRVLELGRSLYEKGSGVHGRAIHGRLGNGVELTGSAVACANCHGHDGRGSVEGGLRAPDIRWSSLTDQYAPVQPGLPALPYDRSSLLKALTTGHRPDGTVLNPAMPRFDLTEAEVSALIEQLVALSPSASPPLAPLPAVLGLVPQLQRDRTVEQFVRTVEQCPETVRLHPIASIRWIRYRDPDDALRQLEEIRVREGTLLLIAPYIVGWEERFAEWTASRPVTVVLPFALWSPVGSDRWLYRVPSIERQVERLIEAAAQQGAAGVTVAIDRHDRLSARLGAVAEQMATARGLSLLRWPERSETRDRLLEQPLLWLTNMKSMELLVGQTVPRTILIPSLFYHPSNMPRGSRWAKAEWIVAYPYNPREPATGRWQAPATVWGAAACHLLALLAENLEADTVLSRPLTIAPFPLVLMPRQTDDEARALVGLVTNPRGYAR
ncbi:MAG: cytochrome c [Nitrospira sp.]|nr:cytochrome c [Nitrospira sp.]MCP9442065.1 cytochrome c [Nitrospira sp.]